MVDFIIELPKLAVALFLSFIAIVFLINAIKLFHADESIYKQNNKASNSFKDVLKGTVPTKKDGVRSHKVVAGIAYDLKNKKVISQGTLSNESIENLLR